MYFINQKIIAYHLKVSCSTDERITVYVIGSLVYVSDWTAVKQLSAEKQSSPNVTTEFLCRQTKRFTLTRQLCPPPCSKVQLVSRRSNVQGEHYTCAFSFFSPFSSFASSSFFFVLFFLLLLFFRSTPPSRTNKAGLKCPSVRPSVHKDFLWFQWNLICR